MYRDIQKLAQIYLVILVSWSVDVTAMNSAVSVSIGILDGESRLQAEQVRGKQADGGKSSPVKQAAQGEEIIDERSAKIRESEAYQRRVLDRLLLDVRNSKWDREKFFVTGFVSGVIAWVLKDKLRKRRKQGKHEKQEQKA